MKFFLDSAFTSDESCLKSYMPTTARYQLLDRNAVMYAVFVVVYWQKFLERTRLKEGIVNICLLK